MHVNRLSGYLIKRLPILGGQLFPGRGLSTGRIRRFCFRFVSRYMPGQMSTGSMGWWTTRIFAIATFSPGMVKSNSNNRKHQCELNNLQKLLLSAWLRA